MFLLTKENILHVLETTALGTAYVVMKSVLYIRLETADVLCLKV